LAAALPRYDNEQDILAMITHYRLGGALVLLLAIFLQGFAWSQEAELPEREDTAVTAVLKTNPTTPAAMTRAAKILADLQRPDLAKQFLQKVLGAKLNQKQLAALEEEFGSALFTELGAREDLAPEGRQLAEAVLAAVSAELRDPKRIEQLVNQLNDPSEGTRSQAFTGLLKARSASVGPLVKVLDNTARASEHANVRACLVRLGSDALWPLVAVLDAADAKLKIEAIRVLAEIKGRESILALLEPFASASNPPEVRAAAREALLKRVGQLPSAHAAANMLADDAKRLSTRRQPLDYEIESPVEVWSWDSAAGSPVSEMVAPDEASRRRAAGFARKAFSIAPDDPDIRLLHLTSILEQAAYENGRDKPLDAGPGSPAAEVAEQGVQGVESLLRYAVDSDHPAAATAAAKILGRIGSAAELLYRGREPTALVAAARHPDRRLRFAAANAILELQPPEPFAGANFVTEAMGYFAGTSGQRRALVADPSRQEAERVGGYLAALGYEVDTATTGQELVRLALSSPDYELAMVAASIEQPTPNLLIQQLRRDPRTARLPVGILARSGEYVRAQDMARKDPLAEAFHRQHTEDAVLSDVERLMRLLGRDLVAHAERQGQAEAALDRLVTLSAEGSQGVFSIQPVQPAMLAVLYVPRLGSKAATVLGNVGTPQSQQALVEVASRPTLPLELRQAAAKAFGRSIESHGILLTKVEILRQYDRYNASATLDVDTQQVLGFILDAIETPTRVVVENGAAESRAEN
jgi:CheY-like chemotaxis protein